MNDDRLIKVCSECKQASCWYGEFMCDNSKHASTKNLTIRELKKLNYEGPDYWSDEKLIEVYGCIPDFK